MKRNVRIERVQQMLHVATSHKERAMISRYTNGNSKLQHWHNDNYACFYKSQPLSVLLASSVHVP